MTPITQHYQVHAKATSHGQVLDPSSTYAARRYDRQSRSPCRAADDAYWHGRKSIVAKGSHHHPIRGKRGGGVPPALLDPVEEMLVERGIKVTRKSYIAYKCRGCARA